MAEESSVIPVRLDGKFLDVAMSNPTNLGIIDELRMRTQLNVRPYLAGPYMLQRALARFYARGAALNLDASFLDPGFLDTHTVVVDWGDGVTETLPAAAAGQGAWTVAAANVIANLLLGLLAVWAGVLLGRAVIGGA